MQTARVPSHTVSSTAPDLTIRRASRGDARAWRELVARHGPRVFGLCRRLDPDPEDAYQEIWEKVFRALPGFDEAGRASLRTWLAVIAHRHLVDRHRRRGARGTLVALDGHEPDGPAPDAEVRLDRERRRDRLETALAKLPEGQRRVLVMHHLCELPLDEIAVAEGVPIGTLKSRLHRGRGRLAELLGGDR